MLSGNDGSDNKNATPDTSSGTIIGTIGTTIRMDMSGNSFEPGSILQKKLYDKLEQKQKTEFDNAHAAIKCHVNKICFGDLGRNNDDWSVINYLCDSENCLGQFFNENSATDHNKLYTILYIAIVQYYLFDGKKNSTTIVKFKRKDDNISVVERKEAFQIYWTNKNECLQLYLNEISFFNKVKINIEIMVSNAFPNKDYGDFVLDKITYLSKFSADLNHGDTSLGKHIDDDGFKDNVGAFAVIFCITQNIYEQNDNTSLGGVIVYEKCVKNNIECGKTIHSCSHDGACHYLQPGEAVAIPMSIFHESINPKQNGLMTSLAAFFSKVSLSPSERRGKSKEKIKTRHFEKKEFLNPKLVKSL
jgi:hypothetical protein